MSACAKLRHTPWLGFGEAVAKGRGPKRLKDTTGFPITSPQRTGRAPFLGLVSFVSVDWDTTCKWVGLAPVDSGATILCKDGFGESYSGQGKV